MIKNDNNGVLEDKPQIKGGVKSTTYLMCENCNIKITKNNFWAKKHKGCVYK